MFDFQYSFANVSWEMCAIATQVSLHSVEVGEHEIE